MDDDNANHYDDYVDRVVEKHAGVVEYLVANAPRLAGRKRETSKCAVEENGVFLWNVWFGDDDKLISYLTPITYPMSAEVHVDDAGNIQRVEVKRSNGMTYYRITEAIYSFADGVITNKEFPQ